MKRLLFCGLSICLLCAVASAQAKDSKTGLMGEVVDFDIGAVIVDARLTITSKIFRGEARTDSNGRYKVSLPNGSYDVEVQARGFQSVRRKKVKVVDGSYFIFNVNMKVDQGQRVDEKHP